MSGEKNVVQCNGPVKHFYDANKYDRCPHCGASAENPQGEKKPHGFFGGMFGKTTNNTKTQGIFSDSKGNTFSMKNEQGQKPVVKAPPTPVPPQPYYDPKPQQSYAVQQPKTADGGTAFNSAAQSTPGYPNNKHEEPANASEVNNKTYTSNSNAAAAVKAPDNDGKTMGHWYGKKNNDPVVGWLVCVKGENQGESFQIVSGRNTIGRRETNDIALTGESSVSRENHATIFYDYKKSEFYINAGEGNTMPYVNDEMVTTMTKLNRYDVVEIGDCICVFVPFCSEEFSWDKYIKKE